MPAWRCADFFMRDNVEKMKGGWSDKVGSHVGQETPVKQSTLIIQAGHE